MATTGFTRLERAVLDAICEMNPSDRSTLEAQLSAATVRSRENTGAGFFTYIDTDRDSNPSIAGERRRYSPAVKIDGLQRGMGFILWLDEGYASFLEGYSYEESTAAIDFGAIQFEVILPP